MAKVFYQIQHPLIITIKTLSKLEKRAFLQPAKEHLQKIPSIAIMYLIVKDWRLQPREQAWGMDVSPCTSIPHPTGGPGQCKESRKGNKKAYR